MAPPRFLRSHGPGRGRPQLLDWRLGRCPKNRYAPYSGRCSVFTMIGAWRRPQKANVCANFGRSVMPHTNAQARDLNDLFHPYTNLKLLEETGPLIIERGKGVRVYDTAGRDYI